MHESEIKLVLRNDLEIDKILADLLKSTGEPVNYFDEYFDTPKGEFSQTERELRLRRITSSAKVEWRLTAKSPPFDAGIKVQGRGRDFC